MPTIGTCSKCNGPVQVPELWGGTVPPVPTCAHCGATAKDPYGPRIPMQGRTQRPDCEIDWCAARTLGAKKRGYTDGLYDAEKVAFFGARMVAQEKGRQGGSE